jgi:hypothetical protein
MFIHGLGSLLRWHDELVVMACRAKLFFALQTCGTTHRAHTHYPRLLGQAEGRCAADAPHLWLWGIRRRGSVYDQVLDQRLCGREACSNGCQRQAHGLGHQQHRERGGSVVLSSTPWPS